MSDHAYRTLITVAKDSVPETFESNGHMGFDGSNAHVLVYSDFLVRHLKAAVHAKNVLALGGTVFIACV